MAIEILIESQIQPFDNVAEFPATGAEKTIYIAKDINAAYYWNGSAYILIVDPTEVLWGDIGGDLLNQSDLIDALNLKVDKVAGKGLSTEDYTTAEKSKLAGIQAGAQVNVKADWNATGGDAEILNKPDLTIYATNSALTSGLATKQDVLGFTPVPTTRTLTINGTTQDLSANRTFTIPTDLTVGTTPIASGTIGRVLFQGTGNVLQQSSSLFWDGTNNRLGVGTSSPAYSIENVIPNVFGGSNVGLLISDFNISFSGSSSWLAWARSNTQLANSSGIRTLFIGNNGFEQAMAFHVASGGNGALTNISATEAMRITNTKNVLINTTTDAGFRLDVNGTARVSGNTTFGTIATGTGMFWDNTNNRLGIGTGSPSYILHVRRDTSVGAELCIENLNTGVNASSNFRFITNSGFTTIGMNGSNDTGIGSNRIYMYSGTGASGIALRASQSTQDIRMYTGGDTASNLRMAIFSTGNVGINTTTDAGFKLDVNGTARVDQTLRLNGTGNAELINFGGNIGRFMIDGSFIRFKASNGLDLMNMNANFLGILQTSVIPSAVVAITSTDRGFLPPRMTTTQRNAIASPAAGLVVYDNTDNKHYGYNGTTWNAFY